MEGIKSRARTAAEENTVWARRATAPIPGQSPERTVGTNPSSRRQSRIFSGRVRQKDCSAGASEEAGSFECGYVGRSWRATLCQTIVVFFTQETCGGVLWRIVENNVLSAPVCSTRTNTVFVSHNTTITSHISSSRTSSESKISLLVSQLSTSRWSEKSMVVAMSSRTGVGRGPAVDEGDNPRCV